MLRYIALLLWLAGAAQVTGQDIALPPSPLLSARGFNFIVNAETDGERIYNRNPHPEWPGGPSGVTVGIGYDCGYSNQETIIRDWLELNGIERLAQTAGITGDRARILTQKVKDILVPWDISVDVFSRVDIPRYYDLTLRTFPGMDGLLPDAQAALISLVFNRGESLYGPRRVEMRQIRAVVPQENYHMIAFYLREMKRVWDGTPIRNGMYNRREAEARLVESCIGQENKVDQGP